MTPQADIAQVDVGAPAKVFDDRNGVRCVRCEWGRAGSAVIRHHAETLCEKEIGKCSRGCPSHAASRNDHDYRKRSVPGRQIERCAKLDIAGVDGQLFPSSLNAHRPKLLTVGGCEDQRCDTIMGS